MDEHIVNTWKELVFNNPELTTSEIIEKVQMQFNISFGDVMGAISRFMEKTLTVGEF